VSLQKGIENNKSLGTRYNNITLKQPFVGDLHSQRGNDDYNYNNYYKQNSVIKKRLRDITLVLPSSTSI